MIVQRIGIAIVSTMSVGLVFGLAIVDAVFGSRDLPTIGERLQTWTKKNPWFSAVLSLILGVLISHFFWPGG